MLIVEGLAFAGALALTAAVGIPIALSAGQAHQWLRPAVRDRATRRQEHTQTTPFKPLDLGPDPMRWPSEREWQLRSTLQEPDWPSKTWEDEHFGRPWREGTMVEVKDRGFHAMAARRYDESAPAPPEGAKSEGKPRPPRAQKADEPARSRSPEPQKARSAPPKKRASNQRTAPARRGPAQPSAAQPSAEAPAGKRPPDELEIEHLIATVGLAGTVQAIMARTGWEFREAAQYLAKVRRDR